MNHQALEQALHSLGYEIGYDPVDASENTIHHCMVSCDQDSWPGAGATQKHALLDATRRAFPSQAAWKLLTSFVAAIKDDTKAVAEPAPRPAPVVVDPEPEISPAELGRRILQIRKQRNITAAQCARAAGMLAPNWSRLERGGTKATASTLERAAKALHVTLYELLHGDLRSLSPVRNAPAGDADASDAPSKPQVAPAAKPATPGLHVVAGVNEEDDAPEATPPAPKKPAPVVPSARKAFPGLEDPNKTTPPPAPARPKATPTNPASKAVALPMALGAALGAKTVKKTTQTQHIKDVAKLDRLIDEIENAQIHYATYNAHQQRLLIARWAFHARAVEERNVSQTVRDKVHEIILALSNLTGLWWPGSVTALKQHTPPGMAFSSFRSLNLPNPKTWEHAASIVDGYFSDHDSFADGGWIENADKCGPAPESLSDELDECALVMSLILDAPETAWAHTKLDVEEKERARENVQSMVDAVRALRWLRPHATGLHAQRWAKVMGYFRMVAREHIESLYWRDLRDALDGRVVPPQTWAIMVGKDPTEKARKDRETKEAARKVREKEDREAARQKTISTVPVYGARREVIETWLLEAVESLTNPEIAGVALHLRKQILSLDHESYDDARVRSRLRKLRTYLDDDEQPEEAEAKGADEESVEMRDLTEELFDTARTFCRGKTVLFISNRKDKNLEGKLNELFDFDEVDYREAGDVRKIQSVCNSMRINDYDLVLMITAFNSHVAHKMISTSAKKNSVPLVLVAKGRPNACARAIVQAFNLNP